MIFGYLILFLSFFVHLMACTGIRLTAADGSIVHGRTLEFGVEVDPQATIIPRNISFIGKAPRGKGLVYKSKYAAVGMSCFDDPVLMDGMNEKGLVAAAFYFPGFAGYATITKENQSRALSPVEFPHWILTQFATLEEVREALPSIVIGPTVIQGWGPTAAPFHYIVYDASGKSLVIEPVDGTLIVHENELGVITNSPTFDWHMTNLRNFIKLTPFNAPSLQLEKVELSPFGQGSGMVGLPGDFSSPSRFVRATMLSAYSIPSKDSGEAVLQAFHVLNQFDIPKGIARQKMKTDFIVDYTMMTAVKDPQTLKYYYRSYVDPTIKFIDLTQFDLDAKSIKKSATKGTPTTVDVSHLLQ